HDLVDQRRPDVLSHPALKGPWPKILSVEHQEVPGRAGRNCLRVAARVSKDVPVEQVLLYFRDKRSGPFRLVRMGKDSEGGFAARTAPFKGGNRIRYYVEARAGKKVGTTTFHPPSAEAAPVSYRFKK
ncbi:MAG: hypothetical protein V3U11_07760, partial [Planctomycetota bacterium]